MMVCYWNHGELRSCYAFQDLSQPKSEAIPPEGELAVPLLRHQVCYFSIALFLLEFNWRYWRFLEFCCLELGQPLEQKCTLI